MRGAVARGLGVGRHLAERGVAALVARQPQGATRARGRGRAARSTAPSGSRSCARRARS